MRICILLQVISIKERQVDEYGQLHASGIHCAGRIVLNMWRLLRSEIKLNIYTFESCVAALLQQRTPHMPPWLLTQCFKEGPAGKFSVHDSPLGTQAQRLDFAFELN